MDFEEPFERADSSDFVAKATALMPKVNVLVLSDYAKGSLYDCQDLIALARRHKVPVLVDPKGNDFSRYRGADILTPNLQIGRASCREREKVERMKVTVEKNRY